MLKTLDDAGGLEDLTAAHEAVSAYHGNNYLSLIERFYRSHRPAFGRQVTVSVDIDAFAGEM